MIVIQSCLTLVREKKLNVHWSVIELSQPEIKVFFVTFTLPTLHFWESQDGQDAVKYFADNI